MVILLSIKSRFIWNIYYVGSCFALLIYHGLLKGSTDVFSDLISMKTFAMLKTEEAKSIALENAVK